LDAKHVKVRDHGRVVSKALVVAYAVHETGLREVIGLDIGEVESGSFWVEFLRGLKNARPDRPERIGRTARHRYLGLDLHSAGDFDSLGVEPARLVGQEHRDHRPDVLRLSGPAERGDA
jgi:hypothetical protein